MRLIMFTALHDRQQKNIIDRKPCFCLHRECSKNGVLNFRKEIKMTDEFAKQFVKDRNEAFTDFVLNDDLTKFKAYAKKYEIEIPPSITIMKAAIYKAVQECTDISDEVKEIAFVKCIKLGFSPFMFEG